MFRLSPNSPTPNSHGEILAEAAKLADAGKLKPLLNERRFRPHEIGDAHEAVERGALGKVVVVFQE